MKHALRSLPFARFARAAIAAAVLTGAAAGAADATLLVNKAFSPSSVALGQVSTVTVTLSNTDTANAAHITAFSDDISTMGGKATFASPTNLATTCTGGTPSISGTVVSMNNGAIPQAVNPTTPGSCTVTFNVVGAALGNGINTIPAGALQTSNEGSNADPSSQTLQVVSSPLGITTSTPTSVLTNQTTTQSFTITNPTAATLTGGAYKITATAGASFSLSNAVISCSTGGTGGSVVFSAFPATSGTATVSGLTIPPNGSCTVTVTASVPPGAPNTTVTMTVPAAGVTVNQGLTNTSAASTTAKFFTGNPNFSKSFSPNVVVPGSTTRMSVVIGNVTQSQLTSVAFTDNLPAGLTLDATPAAAFTNCGTPTVGGAGTGTLTFSGGTNAASTTLGSTTAASTCTVTVTVDVSPTAPASITNTIPAANLTNAQGLPGATAATGTLTVSSSGTSTTKAFSSGSAARLTPVTVTLTFRNATAVTLTSGTFTDNLPQTPIPMAGISTTAPTFTNCGASPSVTFSNANTVVNGSGLSVAAGATCTVKFAVNFLTSSPTTQTDTNYLRAANVVFLNGATPVSPPNDVFASLNTTTSFVVKNYLASAYGLTNAALTVQGQIVDQAGPLVTDTNASATFVLNNGANHNVKLAPAPNFIFGNDCPGGLSSSNVTIGSGGESFTVNIPSLNSSCTITYNVINEVSGATGTFTPGTSSYTSSQNNGTNTTGATNNVTFSTTSLNVNKIITPNSIASGSTTTAAITIAPQPIVGFPTTQANGVTFADALPANLQFAAPPNVVFSAQCQQSGQPAPSYSITGSTITVSNVSVYSTLGYTGPVCTVSFDLTSTTLGSWTNTLPAGSVTSASGSKNTTSAASSVSIVAGVGLQKSFLAGSIPVGGIDYARFLITNSSSGSLGNGTMSDTMPTSLVLNSTTAQPPAQPGDPPSCGGTITGTVGTNVFNLTNMTVGGQVAGVPGRCVQYVQISTTATATPGSYVNTIPAGGLSIGGVNNTSAASGTEVITPPPALTLTKAFNASTIVPSGTSVLTLTIANTATGASSLSGMALTDSLPKGVLVATVPNASTTCTSGTVTAVAGSASVALAGASIAPAGTCTVTVTVTAATVGTYVNTIASGAVTTNQGASNTAPASATLTVVAAPNVTLTKAFNPTPIVTGGTSTLTLTVANTATGAVALTGLSLSDQLPSGVTIAAVPNASTTCGSGTVSAGSGGSLVSLSGGNVAAAGTCTVSVNVTSASAGTYLNTVPAGNVISDQGSSNGGPASATLVVNNAPGVAIAKSFTPSSVAVNGNSTVTVTVSNTATGAVALTALAFNDTLPSGVVIAATPNASTTCGSGTVTTLPGTSQFALGAGSVAAGASCTVTVSVTGTTPGTWTNTIPANTVTSTQGATNAAPANATLAVAAPNVNLTKAFTPSTINPGNTSVLTISVANTNSGAVALTGVAVSDTLPGGVTIATAPNASTTCGSGNVAATAGGSTVALTAGSVGASATCTISVNVTSATPGTYPNAIAANALTSDQGATNLAPATATLTVVNAPNVTLSKAFSPATIPVNGTSALTLTIANTASGAVALTGVAVSDGLPGGVVIAGTPNPSTTCGGTVSVTPGGTTIIFAGGSIAAGASCAIGANVTSGTPGSYVNTVAAGAVSSTQGATNAAPATANLTVSVPDVTILKAFAPAQITPHGTSVLTITVQNTAPGSIALSGMALTDSLPAGVNVAGTPNASTTCGSGTVTAGAGATSVALAGGSVGAASSCTIAVSVTSNNVGNYPNTIAAGALTTTQGGTNSQPATATLGVANAANVTLTKAFSPTPIFANGVSMLTLTIANTASGASALTSLALTDSLPSGAVVATVPNASTTCGGGTASATAGGASVSLSGGSVAAAASCTVSVDVTSQTPGSYLNTVPAGGVTSDQGATNGSPATATLVVNNAPPVTLTKSFTPSSITLGGTSVLQLTIANTATGAAPLTSLGVSDALPSGISVAATPNASTTCGAGSVTASPGATTLALSGGSVAAGATCTVSVTVTGTTPGALANTIPANAVTSTQGATNTAPATATLTVAAPNVTLTKAFSPSSIFAGNVSTLTLTVANTASGAVALTGLALSDTLPAGVTIGLTPGSTTCGSGTVTAPSGGTSVGLTGGSVGAGATCTITVNVTSTTPGSYVNTVAANNVTSDQGATNGAPAAATLTVNVAPAVTLSKTFTPAQILVGGTSVLDLTIANTATGAAALTNLALTDALPSNVAIAGTPNASTTCGSGNVAATPGGTNVALTGGNLAAGGTCTVSVTVTSSTPGAHLNTVPAGAVTSTQGGTNSAAATATLTVNAPNVTLSKAFSPTPISVAGTSALTITVSNTAANAVALTGVALTDTLPANVTIAGTPNASTTCGSGTASATAGGSSVALTGGGVGANGTCTITVSVTSSTPGSHVNTIPANALTSGEGATNSGSAQATLVVNAPNVTLSKAFSPTPITVGGTSALTITVANTAANAVALSGVALTDTLPANVAIAGTPGASTTCGSGTASATAGGSSVALAGGSVGAGASCTITVNVTSSTPGSHVNTIPANALTSNEGATNSAAANATLVVNAPDVTLTKAFSPTPITVGGTSVLTITVANTAANSVALSGVALTDTLPANVAIAGTPNAATTCGSGTASATAGGNNVALAGGGVGANGTCTITVNVTSSTPGSHVNTIPANALTSTEGATNSGSAQATLVVNAPDVTLTKAFSPTPITVGGTSVLTITVANTAANSVALSGVALTDTLPANVAIAGTPNAATTCGSGTASATAGGSSVALTGGGVGAGASCAITVNVTSSTPGSHVNTIPANALTSTEGATNSGSAQATLVVNAPDVTLTKAFSPTPITVGGTSALTITIANTAANAVALSGVALTDTLPANVTIAGTPNAATTCGSGTASATGGGSSVALTGGGVGAGASCAITVNVTSSTPGAHVNTIPANALTSTEGATNSGSSQATLVVNAPDVTLTKAFSPTPITVGGTSALTITVANTATNAVALSGVALTDTLPANVTIAGTPNASTTCGSGTASATAGGSSVALAGGSVGAGANCTITVNVTSGTPGSHVNTIPASALTSNEGATNTAPASATLVVNAPNLTLIKAFSPTPITVGGTSVLTITVQNTAANAVALSGVALTDTLPANVAIASTPNAATSCGSGTAAATAGGNNVALTGGSVGAGASCTITVNVTSGTPGSHVNTIPANALTSNEGATNTVAANATLVVNAPNVTLTKAFSPTPITVGGTSVLTITVANTAANSVALSGVALTDTLPANVAIAGTPGASTTCGSGTASATAGGNNVALTGGSVGAGANCTITVNVTSSTPGSHVNTIPANALTSNEGATNAAAANASLVVNAPNVTLTKAFSPTPITVGGTSILTVTLANTAANSVALSGVALTDTLPANVTIANTPNAATTCGSGTASATAGGNDVALTGGSVGANGTCTITVSVTSSTPGSHVNTIPANALTSNEGATNTVAANATLVVNAPNVTLTKAFSPTAISVGGTSVLTITVANTAANSAALSGLALTDTLPANVAIAGTPNAATTCGSGTAAATAGGNNVALTGGSVGAGASCTITVNVTSSTPGSHVNTIPTSALTSNEGATNTVAANATLVVNAPNVTLTKVFSPTPISVGGTSVLTITVANTAANAVALSGLALMDTLPANVAIAGTPNAATSCGSGSASATAGGNNVALTGGSVGANGTCTVTVNVTSSTPGSHVNTIPASALTSTQGATNTIAATATLTVTAPNVTLTKAFSPTPISAGGTSVLTITVANTAANAVALSGVALTDTLPANVTIAGTPGAATTCGSGTASATAGGSSVALAGGSVGAGGTCTITVNVTSSTPGSHVNTIPANALTSNEGATNAVAANATLVVNAPNVTLTKAFSPTPISVGGTSVLTITVQNTAANAVALSGVALTDTLPSGVAIGATPNAATTCGSGTAAATAGGSSVALSGGSVGAGAICTITVNVTSSTPGPHVNTIPANALTSTQGATNAIAATATLVVNAPNVTLTKVFSPTRIAVGGTSVLTITVANAAANAVALSGVALTDTLPSNVTIAATPNAATTCGSGTASATAGGNNVALAGGSVGAGASCSITVNVTSSTPGSHVNAIPANALTSTQGATNTIAATATLTVTAPNVTLTKAFSLASIPVKGTSVLTITVANTAASAVALSGVALTDTLPSGVTIGATPNAATTCGSGTVSATAGGNDVALAGGSVGAGAICTITVNVTSGTPGRYVNTIPAGALTSTQGASNTAPATAALTVLVPNVTLSKAFSPSTIHPHDVSQLTVTVANTGAGAIALTGMSLTDSLPPGVAIAATPNASTTCGAGTVTAAAGGSNLALSAGSLGAAATCAITVNVTSASVGTYTNTIPAGALSTTQGASNSAPASATLTVIPAPNVTLSKAFSPTPVVVGGVSTLTISIANTASGAASLHGLGVSDTLPLGVTVAAVPNASTTCGSGTVTAAAGATAISLAAGSVAAAATCTVTVNVTSAKPGTYVNTIPAGGVSSTEGASNTAPANATLVVQDAPPVTLTKAFTPAAISLNGTSVLHVTIANTAAGAAALTSLAVTDALPSGVEVAATPNASTTCGSGSVTAASGATSVALTGGSVAAAATCTVSVTVTGVAPGSHVNTIPANAVTSTQGATNKTPATATLTVSVPNVTLSKAFSPATIATTGVSKLTITVANMASGAVALSGLALTDALPANVTIAPVPGASTTCGSGSVAASAGGSSVALSGGSVGAAATCTITVNVTSAFAGAYTNTIPAGALVSAQGATNGAAASAVLTVVRAPNVTLSKAFAPASISVNGTSTLTITVANTAAGAFVLTGLALGDALPRGVTIAAVPNASTTCGSGTVSAPADGANVALLAGSVGAGATCTISVNVTSAAPGNYVNTIPAGNVASNQGASNGGAATADLKVIAPGVTITKAFSPATIHPHGASALTITIANTSAGSIALSGMQLTDALPAGVSVAATPNASTTCGTGTVNARAGDTNVALSGGSIGAGATCTVTVNVTSDAAGSYVNTIPAGALSTTQGSTNPGPATATLTVVNLPNVTIAKTFTPATIAAHGTSQLAITISNTASGAQALGGMALTDTLPGGVTIAASPNASTTCGSGSVQATAGGASATLSGGSIAAGATCTVLVNVTSASPGSYLNAIPAGAVTTTQGATNSNATSATLTVTVAPPVTITKSFSPPHISPHGVSRLTIALNNSASGAVSLTGAALTDALPAGVTIAATPDAATTCASGTVRAIAGGASVALFGASLPAGATCTVAVNVTGATPGQYVNTIPAGALTSAQGATNAAPASATLTVGNAAAVTLAKAFSTNVITPNGRVGLTITIANQDPNSVPLTGIIVTDALPAGMVVASPAGASTTCGAGTVTAIPGSTEIALSDGSLAARSSCSFTAVVTVTGPGTYVNTIPVSNVVTNQGVSNPDPASASLHSTGADLQVTKTASAQVATTGDRVNYAITVAAPAGVPVGETTIVDQLPQFEVFAPGTARINGRPQEPVVSGHTLTWTVPSLGAGLVVTYSTVIAPGAQNATTLTNTVTVTGVPPGGGKPLTGIATASVQVAANTFGNCYPITGRVYLDSAGTGTFQSGDAGIAGVRIYMEDGESVQTDPHGRYNFPCVRPGMHALRLDESSLPDGVTPYGDHNIDSERSTRRLIHGIFDDTIIQDINFAVQGTLPAAPAQQQQPQRQQPRHRRRLR